MFFRAGAQVPRSPQSNGGAPRRDVIRTGRPRSRSRSASRRPVLPVPPTTRKFVVMAVSQPPAGKTLHSSQARSHVSASTLGRMDPLAALLDGPRAHGAFLLRSVLTPPWCLRIEDEAPLTVVSVVRGQDPYLVADQPSTPPQALILPGQECRTPDGGHLTDYADLGVRTWGTGGPVVLLAGTYGMAGEISKKLMAALPTLIVLRVVVWPTPLVG